MANTVKDLNVLLASLDALCIKSRGFSFNVESRDFYEYHTFLNLTIEMLHKAGYDVGERVRSLKGHANYSVAELRRLSMIKDVPSVVTDPAEMVECLLPDYEMLAAHCNSIFKATAKAGDSGTVALVSGLTSKLEHFAWELRVMQKGAAVKQEDRGRAMQQAMSRGLVSPKAANRHLANT